jgi:hypothetical protein
VRTQLPTRCAGSSPRVIRRHTILVETLTFRAVLSTLSFGGGHMVVAVIKDVRSLEFGDGESSARLASRAALASQEPHQREQSSMTGAVGRHAPAVRSPRGLRAGRAGGIAGGLGRAHDPALLSPPSGYAVGRSKNLRPEGKSLSRQQAAAPPGSLDPREGSKCDPACKIGSIASASLMRHYPRGRLSCATADLRRELLQPAEKRF